MRPDALNHSQLHLSSHEVRVDEGMTKPLSLNSSNGLFLQKSSQSLSPQRLSGVLPSCSSSGSTPPVPRPFLSGCTAKSASWCAVPYLPQDGMLQSSLTFIPSPARNAKMASLPN